ncbi:hypothetical protein SCHPADRAFT_656040 [Schizopora paradoxa]|uniref:Uncharacterized protein n=1 Tax=Schizopora paradoxa TaxID=27342 RepID=A0A0H2RCQ2_9AGAM|nr:hypothetical protein SCHPADRAFT_656040 [Schizopora paradoxa]
MGRLPKYGSAEELHEARKGQKRAWYARNRDTIKCDVVHASSRSMDSQSSKSLRPPTTSRSVPASSAPSPPHISDSNSFSSPSPPSSSTVSSRTLLKRGRLDRSLSFSRTSEHGHPWLHSLRPCRGTSPVPQIRSRPIRSGLQLHVLEVCHTRFHARRSRSGDSHHLLRLI